MTEPLKLRVLLKERAPNGVTCTRVRKSARETGNGSSAWSELHATGETPDRGPQRQVAHCCDDEDADLIQFALNNLADHLEQANKIEELEHRLCEAESALWRIYPNSHTVPVALDPFEGPGETYRAAYERLLNRADKLTEALKTIMGEIDREDVRFSYLRRYTSQFKELLND